MDLQEILSEVGEEKAAIINAAIQAEQKKGIDTSKKKGAENTKLIQELARLKDALREAAGIEDFGEDPVETIKAKVSELKTVKQPEGVKDIESLKASIMAEVRASAKKETEALRAQLAEKEKAAEMAQTKFRNAKITSQLSEQMNGKIRGHDYVIKDWIREGKVKLDDNDQIVFVGQDETDLIDGKKYLDQFTKERSDLVISQQIPGGGSAGNRVDVNKVKQISVDQFQKLPIPTQQAFMQAGGKVLDQQ
jgi:hypothetical protein